MNSTLVPVEYKNQRILTTGQLAEAYETESKVISNNFNRNKNRYGIGKHYFCLEGEDKREFVNRHQIEDGSKNAQVIYLWTEKGALLHAKSLNTDRAWEAYDLLVDSYFRMMEEQKIIEELSPEIRLLLGLGIEQRKVRQEAEFARIEAKNAVEKVKSICEIVAINPTSDWREESKTVIYKIAQKLGGFEHIESVRHEIYEMLDKRYAVNLTERLRRKRERMAYLGVSQTNINKVNKLDVIADDKKLVEGFVSIMKEVAIKYGIESAVISEVSYT